MTGYELYIFILCLVVFVALSVFFAIIIAYILKMNLKLIRGGLVDETIKKQQEKEKHRTAVFRIFEKVFSALFLLFSIAVFGFSLEIKINENQPISRTAIKVVVSQSMSEKEKSNLYLFENNLNNQVEMFDLIVMNPLPKEEEIKLYDIVIYETQGQMVLHRIVEIKEVDEQYNLRRYIFKGDANKEVDKTPVLYSQMRGIYRGNRIQYVGSFVIFINSPAGYLCIFLIAATLIAYPLIERKLVKEIKKRLAVVENNSFMNTEENNDKTEEISFVINDEASNKNNIKIIEFEEIDNASFDERVFKLTSKQEDYYLDISLHASLIKGSRRIKNDQFEEYKIGSDSLVKFEIHNGIIRCLFNQNIAKTIPAFLDIIDEKTLNEARENITCTSKLIKEKKSIKRDGSKKENRLTGLEWRE